MAPSIPRVGVVIVNHDQKALLAACLDSWAREGYGAELLVSDNDSTDGALDMLREGYPQVRVLSHVPEIGFAAAASAGLRALAPGHDYLFLTTNDTLVQPGLLAALVAAAEADPQVAVVGPKILFYEPADRLWHAGGRIHPLFGNPSHYGYGQRDDGRHDASRDCDFVSGCGFLLRTAAVAPLGYLRDELAFYAEDSDLCLRLRAAGWRVLYEPRARMVHRESATLGAGSALSTYYITRNSLALLWRHQPLALPGYLGVVLPWRLLKAQRQAPGRFGALARATWLGLRDFCLGRYGLRDPKDPALPLGRPA